jgi:photosystem II stability/assembly factor-like uncharacterized protein
MANGSQVFIGAARLSGKVGGVFRQHVGEDRWEQLAKGLPEKTNVHAITVHPTNPDTVFIGTHEGPYRSTDRGERWEKLNFPERAEVWSITVHPNDARRIYAGTSPVGVFRSDDGGDSWRKLPELVHSDSVKMSFPARVMRLAIDPAQAESIYATLEVAGVMRSLDGGESWSDCSAGLLKLSELPHLKSKIQSDTEAEGMMDGHALAVSAATPNTVYLAVRMGLFRSEDRGTSWQDMQVSRFSPLTYARDVRVSPHDPRTLYACLSPAARSEDGSLWKTTDLGGSWTRVDRGIKAEKTMMCVGLHPRDPKQIYCASRAGQVFGTSDGGGTWRESRLPEGVEDVYAIACA